MSLFQSKQKITPEEQCLPEAPEGTLRSEAVSESQWLYGGNAVYFPLEAQSHSGKSASEVNIIIV